ncbi:conjugal transfer protein MobC [Mucilaginibacter ximonensis]|uniref:Conjugal transfer protein MobC n=1 Tax=Mucilaginibacter ximonensis TaxID=538021 RepID=A0ABW5YAA6_9SPHI
MNGENEQGLRKILDMTRLISIVLLLLHFYFACYAAFVSWHLTLPLLNKLIDNIYRTGLFSNPFKCKLIALAFMAISTLGASGRKDEKMNWKMPLLYILFGLLLYFGSYVCLLWLWPLLYIVFSGAGMLIFLSGSTWLSRIIKDRLRDDIFNAENETFPQEERLLENEYSINLPAEYRLKNKLRKSWINIINPFRGTLVVGSPGSGKSYFVIRHIIEQHIRKGFAVFSYDFKFDDLSKIVYNTFLRYRHLYPANTQIFFIDFDRLLHRCNPLDPASMNDITDAAESGRTILMGLNREWIKRQGDFFVESPINFLTAIIWYLRRFRDGEFCTLPHVIELMQVGYDDLFSVLRTEKEIEVLINPFINAYLNDATEQLEGQIAAAKIAMARLSSPQLYYVLSGNDFTLDINNPAAPKLVCIGNNPQKIQVYGAVISLYVNRLIKQVNQKGKLKSSLIFDEFPTIYLNGVDNLIATARSNKVATTLGIQDFSQLRKDYGREQADVIGNIVGNVVCGQVTGDTAKHLSERFGKIMQDRESISINRQDTSISRSKQLEFAVPASKISGLSSGEFVGMVADNPDELINLKTFHCRIINDHEAIKKEEENYLDIPQVRQTTPAMIQRNYEQIKQDINDLIQSEMQRILSDPSLMHLVIQKKK